MSQSSQSNNQPYTSVIPDLSLPEGGWKSSIPEHLLAKAEPELVWIMQEISKNTQATEFACKAVVAQNQHLKALNGKTFRNEKSAALLEDKVESLEAQAKVMTPFIKPVAQFAALWDYRAFRWIFFTAIFFFFTYLLPWYINHPFNLSELFKAIIPGS